MMKKLLSLLFVICILSSALTVSAETRIKETEGGILYSVQNGEVTVEGFNYAGNVMKVPEKIDGMTVRYVADQACRGNTALTEVRLPDTVLVIGEYAFAECPNLTKVVISGGYEIGASAFRGSKALMSVTLPSTLEKIGDNAFEGCTMLGKIKIPASVTEIGVDAFAGCDRVSFDASENAYAKKYAKQYSIPTSFFDTWEFTVILALVISAILFVVLMLLSRRIKKKKNA